MAPDYDKGSFPPWDRIPGLNEMCAEAGVDFDLFIQDIKDNIDLDHMAAKHEVSLDTLSLLKEHFIKYGLSSVMGGD